jgi:hypothetical protein
MDTFTTQQRDLSDPETMTERVMSEARRTFSDLPDDRLHGVVQGAVTDLWTDSVKVTSFIPVLAMRSVKERIESDQRVAEPSGA